MNKASQNPSSGRRDKMPKLGSPNLGLIEEHMRNTKKPRKQRRKSVGSTKRKLIITRLSHMCSPRPLMPREGELPLLARCITLPRAGGDCAGGETGEEVVGTLRLYVGI
jgi:hypothetical protein